MCALETTISSVKTTDVHAWIKTIKSLLLCDKPQKQYYDLSTPRYISTRLQTTRLCPFEIKPGAAPLFSINPDITSQPELT
jgi:hypothetical protein